MIDQNRILQNLKDFSFPRLSGTKFEKKSFNIAKNKIEALKLIPSIQEFSFSVFYSRVYPKISLTLFSWLLLVLNLYIHPLFFIFNLILIFVLFFTLLIVTRKPENLKLGQTYSSQNLFIKISSQTEKKSSDNNIFLFSHLDSKGQTLSIKFRIQLYYGWIISFFLSLVTSIINSFFLNNMILLLYIFSLLFLILNLIAILGLWLNTTNNKSKGAIDNASGISCVLELLIYYSNPINRLKNYNLWFIFTGAEESGTMGVRNFYKYMKNYDRESSFIVNFDSIAKKVNLWNHGLLKNNFDKSLNYILKNKDIMSIEKTRRFYIGTYSDGLFLLNKKFQGLGNGDKSSYSYIHSVNDDVDKIESSTLKKLCKFYTILLNEVDNNIK